MTSFIIRANNILVNTIKRLPDRENIPSDKNLTIGFITTFLTAYATKDIGNNIVGNTLGSLASLIGSAATGIFTAILVDEIEKDITENNQIQNKND